ncbi:unnamed protein product [Sphagnum jensenii]|uniref:Uncharacterized protein n=1 Tax=Sphagnum jensenii TaxID=128206 RepID=A0ABP0V9Z6_9BRYO
MAMTAQQLFEALKDGLDGGGINPSDVLEILQPDGKRIALNEFDAAESHDYKAGATELRAVGDTVWTTKQLYFVDGINPANDEAIEMKFARGDTLEVVAIVEDLRYECKTNAGMIAYLDASDIEGV